VTRTDGVYVPARHVKLVVGVAGGGHGPAAGAGRGGAQAQEACVWECVGYGDMEEGVLVGGFVLCLNLDLGVADG
jgi:hypothetical protein